MSNPFILDEVEEDNDFTDDGVYLCTDYPTESNNIFIKNQIISSDEPIAVSSDDSLNTSGLTDVVTDFVEDIDSEEFVDLHQMNLSHELQVENSENSEKSLEVAKKVIKILKNNQKGSKGYTNKYLLAVS